MPGQARGPDQSDPALGHKSSQGDNPNIALTRPHMIGTLTLSADPWRWSSMSLI